MGSLALIKGKSCPRGAEHLTTLAVQRTCQMPRYFPAGVGRGVQRFTLTGAL